MYSDSLHMQTLADRAPKTWCPLDQIQTAILCQTPPQLRMAPAREVAEPLSVELACADFFWLVKNSTWLL